MASGIQDGSGTGRLHSLHNPTQINELVDLIKDYLKLKTGI
jgi:hypothetical protein